MLPLCLLTPGCLPAHSSFPLTSPACPPPACSPLLAPPCLLPPAAKFINILAEEPAVVAAWLVPRLRCAAAAATTTASACASCLLMLHQIVQGSELCLTVARRLSCPPQPPSSCAGAVSATRVLRPPAPCLACLPCRPCAACRGVAGNGEYIKYLTMPGVVWRFITAARRRSRFVPEDGSGGYQRLPPNAGS